METETTFLKSKDKYMYVQYNMIVQCLRSTFVSQQATLIVVLMEECFGVVCLEQIIDKF